MKEMIGKKFGNLRVLDFAGTKGAAKHKAYLCQCDCGNQKIIVGSSIRAGRSKSCGCLSKKTQFDSQRTKKHGESRSQTYRIWHGIKQRCSPSAKGAARKNYFEKGIKVCDRWMLFENFLADMGHRPTGCSIERIDGTKNYEPSNCKWATPKEQANNTSANHFIEFDGKRQTIAQWADELGLKPNTLAYRLQRVFAPGLHK